tara:strand:- start:68 stop:703 length:636 start_codon:yes stop_codon:yes gene_type:complete
MNRDYYVNMFSPPPLGVTQFTGDIRYIEKLVREYEFQRNTCNSITVTDTILDDPQFIDLRNFILNFVHRYTEKVCRSKQAIELKQSWANITDTNEIHPTHMHPNSFISGVMFVKSDSHSPPLMVENPWRPYYYSVDLYSGDTDSQLSPNEFESSLAPVYQITPDEGKIVLFPSPTPHFVPESYSEHDRITLAFNTYPTRPFGSKKDVTYVH